MARLDFAEQRAYAGFAGERLGDELDRAAARQAEAPRLVGGDAIGDDLAARRLLPFAPRAITSPPSASKHAGNSAAGSA